MQPDVFERHEGQIPITIATMKIKSFALYFLFTIPILGLFARYMSVPNPDSNKTVKINPPVADRVVDIQGNATQFNRPRSIAIDSAGNLYVTDTGNKRIRKVSPKGKVSTFTGEHAVQFNRPENIAIDAAGNLYVADTATHRIYRVLPTGEVSTVAGGRKGLADGEGSAAQFDTPRGIVIDAAGHLYVVDSMNDRIRRVSPSGEVSTVVGGKRGDADGDSIAAQFDQPHGIAIDAAGNLYVADTGNHRIRKVSPKGVVSTLAGGEKGFADGQGSAAQFDKPSGITIDVAGNLYVADRFNNRIRKVTPKGKVSTFAGSRWGFVDGQGSAARFSSPEGIAIDAAGNLYVADSGSHSIRKLTPTGEVSTLSGGKRHEGEVP